MHVSAIDIIKIMIFWFIFLFRFFIEVYVDQVLNSYIFEAYSIHFVLSSEKHAQIVNF